MMGGQNIAFGCRIIALVTVFFLFSPFSKSFGGSTPKSVSKPFLILNADKQFNYAEKLFVDKDYLTAVNEYKRFVHFFPGDQRVALAMFHIGMAYDLSGHYKEAIHSFQHLIEKYHDTGYSIKAYFKISENYMKLGAVDNAVINLNNLITVTHDEDIKDEAYYRIGWIYIGSASWEKARRYFSKISAKNKNKYRLEELTAELDKEKFIPKKDPQLAGILSIIPGAGYLYCERYQDALIAFLLNGALIWASYESFDDGHAALGGLLTFVGVGFYAGNIYGAVSSAHKYNRKKIGQFIEKLKNDVKINFSADLKNSGVRLSFQIPF